MSIFILYLGRKHRCVRVIQGLGHGLAALLRQSLRQQLSLSADRAIFYFGVTEKALWTGSNLATILTMCLHLELGWI